MASPIDLSIWEPSQDVFISVVTVSELLMGVHRADSEARRAQRPRVCRGDSLRRFGVGFHRRGGAHRGAKLYGELSQQGRLISTTT